jgi:hypothetical protein
VQIVREKFTCRECEKISQASNPFHVLPCGFAGRSLLAMILFEKYGRHQPLNRQSDRYAREGVELSLSTLADQVGGCAGLLRPLYNLIRAHVFAGERVHGDSTPVPVLAKGKTATGRAWAMSATIARSAGVIRRPPFSSIRATARVNIPSAIFTATAESSKPTPVPGNIAMRSTWRPASGVIARGPVRDLSSSQSIRPAPLRCSQTPVEPARPRLYRPSRCSRRSQHSEGFGVIMISGLTPGFDACCLHERRCRRRCKPPFRLAGCAFTGRGSNPLDRFERFPNYMSFLLSAPTRCRSRIRSAAKKAAALAHAIPPAGNVPVVTPKQLWIR